MATLAFNRFFEVFSLTERLKDSADEDGYKLGNTYKDKLMKAMFDARCFNIPKEEVCNCFIWRQQDATRNAIQLLGQTYFSSKELHKKSCNDIQDMLMTQKGLNFNDERTDFKRGSCCYKVDTKWTVDKEIPIFTQDRNFIERFVYIEKE